MTILMTWNILQYLLNFMSSFFVSVDITLDPKVASTKRSLSCYASLKDCDSFSSRTQRHINSYSLLSFESPSVLPTSCGTLYLASTSMVSPRWNASVKMEGNFLQ